MNETQLIALVILLLSLAGAVWLLWWSFRRDKEEWGVDEHAEPFTNESGSSRFKEKDDG